MGLGGTMWSPPNQSGVIVVAMVPAGGVEVKTVYWLVFWAL